MTDSGGEAELRLLNFPKASQRKSPPPKSGVLAPPARQTTRSKVTQTFSSSPLIQSRYEPTAQREQKALISALAVGAPMSSSPRRSGGRCARRLGVHLGQGEQMLKRRKRFGIGGEMKGAPRPAEQSNHQHPSL